jgi:hypothetical protein
MEQYEIDALKKIFKTYYLDAMNDVAELEETSGHSI